ncbi:MAG: hydantoinase/oxoprolinase family protein, partial [Rhodobacteraceae bacterium]|nr:hydantoinase/oxoprolinase family protein [Paracoccaceae bacterium]
MSYLLGVDTGGTYTDAVLMRDEEEVVATSKSLTTRHDLAVGIGGAVRDVLVQAGVQPGEVALVSMSTTLATNALVQGQGDRVCLVFIGFSERDLARQGLDTALQGDPVILLAGGHSHSGIEVAKFDEAGLREALDAMTEGVSGFAVAAD